MICQHHTIKIFYLDYIEQCEQTVYTHNFQFLTKLARGHSKRGGRADNTGLGQSSNSKWNQGTEPLVRGQGAKPPWSWKLWSIYAPKGRPKTLLPVRQDRLNMSLGSSPMRLPLNFPASKEGKVPPCPCLWAPMFVCINAVCNHWPF